MSNRLTIFLVSVAFFAFVAGFARAEERLEIISPHPKSIEDEFGAAFEGWYKAKTGTDIKVVWRDMGGTSDDLRWITSEFAKRPGGIDVDMFFGGGNDPYLQLKDLGVLAPVKLSDEILSGIPKDLSGIPLYDPDGAWYGTAISGFGIIYNKVLFKRLGVGEPKAWDDLANPKLYSWVSAGDPRHSGTVHMMYEIILQAYGWERGWQIITAVGGNTRAFVQAAGDIPRSVAAGQTAAGGAIDFYAWTQIDQAGADKVGFVMPEGVTIINADSIAVLKGAPNPAAAKAFVEFVLTDGQKLWYLKMGSPGGPKKSNLFRMPVRASLYDEFATSSPVKSNPFTWKKGLIYNAQLGTARYVALNDLLGAIVVDSHDDLAAAWKSAIDSGSSDKALVGLATPPVTEARLADLAKTDLADPVKRNALIADWINSARDKYKKPAK